MVEIHAFDTSLNLSGEIWSESVISVLTIHPYNTDILFDFTLNVSHWASAILNDAVTSNQSFSGDISLGFKN